MRQGGCQLQGHGELPWFFLLPSRYLYAPQLTQPRSLAPCSRYRSCTVHRKRLMRYKHSSNLLQMRIDHARGYVLGNAVKGRTLSARLGEQGSGILSY